MERNAAVGTDLGDRSKGSSLWNRLNPLAVVGCISCPGWDDIWTDVYNCQGHRVCVVSRLWYILKVNCTGFQTLKILAQTEWTCDMCLIRKPGGMPDDEKKDLLTASIHGEAVSHDTVDIC